jgi:hypothetical protein
VAWGVFAVLTVLCARLCWRYRAKDPSVSLEACAPANTDEEEPDAGAGMSEGLGLLRVVWWLILSASGSVVLMATLNQMTQDVPPVPFLFVLPLSLYLFTFIMAFGKDYWYKRILCAPLLVLSLSVICISFYMDIEFSLLRRLLLYLAVLFTCYLCCHGELARLRPAPSHLTLFYLMRSLAGGLLVMTVAGLFIMAKILEEKISEGRRGLLAQSRSFYGTLRVTERGTRGGASHAYLLWHGQMILAVCWAFLIRPRQFYHCSALRLSSLTESS